MGCEYSLSVESGCSYELEVLSKEGCTYSLEVDRGQNPPTIPPGEVPIIQFGFTEVKDVVAMGDTHICILAMYRPDLITPPYGVVAKLEYVSDIMFGMGIDRVVHLDAIIKLSDHGADYDYMDGVEVAEAGDTNTIIAFTSSYTHYYFDGEIDYKGDMNKLYEYPFQGNNDTPFFGSTSFQSSVDDTPTPIYIKDKEEEINTYVSPSDPESWDGNSYSYDLKSGSKDGYYSEDLEVQTTVRLSDGASGPSEYSRMHRRETGIISDNLCCPINEVCDITDCTYSTVCETDDIGTNFEPPWSPTCTGDTSWSVARRVDATDWTIVARSDDVALYFNSQYGYLFGLYEPAELQWVEQNTLKNVLIQNTPKNEVNSIRYLWKKEIPVFKSIPIYKVCHSVYKLSKWGGIIGCSNMSNGSDSLFTVVDTDKDIQYYSKNSHGTICYEMFYYCENGKLKQSLISDMSGSPTCA